MSVCYQWPSLDDSTAKIFYRQSREISNPCPYEGFQFPRHMANCTAVTSKPRKCVEFVGDNFWSQVLSESTRKDGLLDV